MNLSAPKQITFVIAVIIFLVGLLGSITVIPAVTGAIALWLIVIAFVLLALANLSKGL